MRWSGVLGVIAISGSAAFAQAPPQPAPTPAPEDEYPVEVVDRPFVLPSGTNEIGIGYARDEDGESESQIFYSHSFGRFEIGVQLATDDSSFIAARFAPIRPLVISFRLYGSGGTYAGGGSRYRFAQVLRASYRIVHVPKRFELAIGGGVSVEELHEDPPMGTFRDGVSTIPNLGIAGVVQLTRNLSVFAGTYGSAIVHSTAGFERDARLSIQSGVELALRRLDFIVGGNLWDLTDTRRFSMFALIAFRW